MLKVLIILKKNAKVLTILKKMLKCLQFSKKCQHYLPSPIHNRAKACSSQLDCSLLFLGKSIMRPIRTECVQQIVVSLQKEGSGSCSKCCCTITSALLALGSLQSTVAKEIPPLPLPPNHKLNVRIKKAVSTKISDSAQVLMTSVGYVNS